MISNYLQKILNENKSEKPEIDKIKELIIQFYNKENNTSLKEELDINNEKYISIIRWFNKIIIDNTLFLHFFQEENLLARKLFLNLSEKASFLGQYNCPYCTSSLPIITIPIRISPISRQASSSKKVKAFYKAIKTNFESENFNKIDKFYDRETKLCIHITFVFSKNTKDKDLDNLAKSILDATKTVLFQDDMQIDHLSLLKLKGSREEDYIYINIRETRINQNEDVIFKITDHEWGGQKVLDLKDFM